MIRSRRRVEWHDTDAAGHQHHSAVLRWVEAAEAELLRSVGCARLFGRTPRVRHEVDYRSRVFFGDEVETTLRVEALGRTSLTYAFDVACDGRPVATGRLVIVHAPSATGGAEPWPDDVRMVVAPAHTSNTCSTFEVSDAIVDHDDGVGARRAE